MFKSLELNNFMSWKHAKFNFSDNGIVLLVGQNGSGKSSVFEALLWVLYGQTLRGLKNDEVVNTKTKKNCSVKLELQFGEVVYQICRFRKHEKYGNSVVLLKNGVDVSVFGQKSVQEQIEHLLGLDIVSFTNAVLFGGGFAKSFLSLTDSEQKAIFDKLVGLEKFDVALSIVKEELKQHTNRMKELDTMLRSCASNIERTSESLQTVYYNYKNFEQNRVEELKHLTTELNKSVKERDELFRLCEANLEQSKILKTKLLELDTEKKSNLCKYCKQPLPFSKQDELDNLQQELRKLELSIVSAEHKLNFLDKTIKDLQDRISKKQSEKNGFKSLLLELKSDLEKLEKQQEELQGEYQTIEKLVNVCEFWVKGFGNEGIKSYMLDTLLPKLQEDTNNYLSNFFSGDFKVLFSGTVQLKSGEQRNRMKLEVHHSGEQFVQKAPSSGERRAIDLSVLWALHNLAKSKASWINVEFYDEVFDTLDEDNREKALTVLFSRAKHSNVWVVSHSYDLKNYPFGVVYVFEKRDGFSTFERL